MMPYSLWIVRFITPWGSRMHGGTTLTPYIAGDAVDLYDRAGNLHHLRAVTVYTQQLEQEVTLSR